MGLDMYLNAERFIWYNEEALKAAVFKVVPDCPGEVKEVKVEAMYWRKANQIHRWFVENIQGGNDDCEEYPVTLEQLTALRDACAVAIKDRKMATAVLPTQSGFFFGSTEYDDYYWKDLESTRRGLTKLIENQDKYKEWSFSYRSSW